MTKEKRLPIMELFGPTIQGEGLMSGTVTHFLRTGGCGLRCTWCDSMFAVDPKLIRKHRTMMTTGEIIDAVKGLQHAPYLTLTGGDPCLHKSLGDIVYALNMEGIKVAVETQGELFPDWLSKVDVVTFSPKPPSAGKTVDYHLLHEWIHTNGAHRRPFKVCIKVVCFSKQDFEYAMRVYEYIPEYYYDAFYFTAGTELEVDSVDERIGKVLGCMQGLAHDMLHGGRTFNHKVHLGCQQHVLLWPDKDKGV